MRRALIAAMLAAGICIPAAAAGDGDVFVHAAVSLGRNLMGGFDYLPDGDILGVYSDPLFASNARVVLIDANGDGVPAGPETKYDLGMVTWGTFLKVSPDGTTALFGESINYTMYSMDLATYAEPKVLEGIQGMYDCAFLTDKRCYVSANPPENPGEFSTTNKIARLDLDSMQRRDVASIEGTFSGPIDVDDEGNLYYVRGRANFPPRAGDFSILRFAAADLEGAYESSTPLGPDDATVIATDLDGGQDVAWHSSGTLFVADANNGRVYAVRADGAVSDFAFIPGDAAEGFWFLAFHGRDLPLAGRAALSSRLAATYQPLSGQGEPDLFILTPPFMRGDRLVLTVEAEETEDRFDAYAALAGPRGLLYYISPGGVSERRAAYARNVDGLEEPFGGTLLDMTIPANAPSGEWILHAGTVPPGAAPSVAGALAHDAVTVAVE
ncbi:MAG: hypothetical protein PHN82_07115 [bacterium]|nr:hypothetical protein [bacterium]